MESRELRWRARKWLAMCERVSSSHFICHGLGWPHIEMEPEELDATAPRELTIDGIASETFSVHIDEYGFETLDVQLAAPLALIEFTPHKEFPPRAGDISYAAALALVSEEHLVNHADIRETRGYWVFPDFQIGCCGALVEKATGKLVEFGSYTGLENWVWGYEQGLLDEPPRDLVILSIQDPEVALRALKDFIQRPTIDDLPETFEGCAVWHAIRPLREAGDALTWRCVPSPRR